MNYKGKKVAITGADGFIGQALLKQFMADYRVIYEGSSEAVLSDSNYIIIKIINGDIRDPNTFADLDYTYDYLFHFAAPSSQVLFKRSPQYCIDTTINGFMNAATAAKQHGIRLIYPSTGLLSMGEVNEYARCKKICEDWAMASNMDAIGLRIFAAYGPGEGHKRDYASVPYLFARDMVAGKNPTIYGDGKQVRDFIYIDDVVQAILHVAEECPDPIIDIGSGESTSFNSIHKELTRLIKNAPAGIYINKPTGYVSETMANPEELYGYYIPKVTFAEGISKLVKHLKEGQQ